VPALIFDCDGVLADTERFGHLPAFNRTFEESGVPLHWTEADYAEKVKIGGGKERMTSAITPEIAAALGIADDESRAAAVVQWHRRKTEIYTQLVQSGALPPRPGIRRIVEEADRAGWSLAVASTSAEPAVRAVLEHSVGPVLAERFAVLAGDVVRLKKPAPDIYFAALDALDIAPADAVVIEDSENGLRAARGAGLRTIITVSSYTTEEDFAGAALVVSSLGDPSGARADTLADPYSLTPGDVVTLADVARLLAQPLVEVP